MRNEIGSFLVALLLLPAAEAGLTGREETLARFREDRAGVRPSEGRLALASPESQGVPSAAITNWIAVCEREIDALHGFVILRHGMKIAEGTWAPFDTLAKTHMLYSHSKSFTATAIGFLVDAGKLDLDERVVDIFADKVPANPSDNLKALRVRDLLTMNVGANRTDSEDKDIGGDWERNFLTNEIDVKPGTRFRYDSSATYMLAAIVGRKSGKDLMAFLKEKLFDKIGISSAWSSTCPNGTPCGGWGMYMTTGDMARFGQFLLNEGTWNGERILSAEWIRLATARQTWSGPIGITGQSGNDWAQGYGFQFWRCRHDAYRADGADGQFTIVVPKADLVVSLHAGCRTTQKEVETVWDYLLTAMKDAPLKENPEALKALRDRCASLAIPPLAGAASGADRYLGKTFAFEKNRRGFKTIRLEGAGEGLEMSLETPAGQQKLPVGFGEWKTGEVAVDPESYEGLGMYIGRHPTAASAAVGADGALKVRVYVTDTPGRFDFTFALTNGMPSVTGNLRIMRGCELTGAVK